MTLLEALPRSECGDIVIPIGSMVDEHEFRGNVDVTWFTRTFADIADAEVPLSEPQYQALLAASTPMWQRNWERFRQQGII